MQELPYRCLPFIPRGYQNLLVGRVKKTGSLLGEPTCFLLKLNRGRVRGLKIKILSDSKRKSCRCFKTTDELSCTLSITKQETKRALASLNAAQLFGSRRDRLVSCLLAHGLSSENKNRRGRDAAPLYVNQPIRFVREAGSQAA